MIKTLKRLRHKSNILILVTLLVVSVVELVHIDILSYLGGLRNDPSWGGCILLPLYELCKIGIVLFALIRIDSSVQPRRDRKKRIITALLSIMIFIGSWILCITLIPPQAFFFLMGYEKWVQRNVDVDAIQTFLMSKEADVHSGQYYHLANLPDDLPHFMTDFGPKHFMFREWESRDERSVTFEWGGALMHWGFVVGSPMMKIKQKGWIQHGGSEAEYRQPIRPGIYVYYD